MAKCSLMGFSKKKPAFVSPVNDKIGDAHLGVDFFSVKKSTPFDHLMPFVFTL